ncbi:MAG: hypothetical protein HZA16_05230 [Nitrospirae bacterium]|nr:hypothetical protein [Nitrospirota bacterium]
MDSSRRKYKPVYAVLILDLLIYTIFAVSSHHYERLTGDSTLYLSIAEKYVRGDFSNAVNGYWGPLLSWLLVPFLYLGASHVFTINAVNLIFGWLALIGVWKLSGKFRMDDKARGIILLPMVPILLFFSLIEPMDFLLLCVLIFYLNAVASEDYPDRLSNAVFSGTLGAYAYFAKPYGFPFFISHFLLINAYHYFRVSSEKGKKSVLKNAIAGLVVFSLLSGVWISLISIKYNKLTFSNMGRGVFASLGPGSTHNTLEKGDPIFFEGFFEPPNETAFVIYEDPSYARKKTWNPLESRRSFKHFLSNFTENIFEGLRIYDSFSRLSIAIVIIYILLVFSRPFKELLSRGELLWPLLTVILYTGGYTPFHFEARYLWIVNILLLLMGGKALHELFQTGFFKNRTTANILTVFFIVSFIVTPVKSFLDISNDNINKGMHVLGAELGRRYDIRGNIASNREKVEMSSHDAWHRTFRLAYWLNSRYFGQARENVSDEELKSELLKYKIDYYFFWGDPKGAPQFLSHYRELTRGEMPGLAIYSLNDKIKEAGRVISFHERGKPVPVV